MQTLQTGAAGAGDRAAGWSIRGKTVLFTGASRGMGRFAAIELPAPSRRLVAEADQRGGRDMGDPYLGGQEASPLAQGNGRAR
jgi:NAD(P)-dependent dehydrogenase (short-subunit alcohol dehydrogenase family)